MRTLRASGQPVRCGICRVAGDEYHPRTLDCGASGAAERQPHAHGGRGSLELPDDLDIPSAAREDHSFIAHIDPVTSPVEGGTIPLQLEPERVQLFDTRSGKNPIRVAHAGAAAD